MLKQLVDLRDFCYMRLEKHEGETMARWWYKIQLMGFFVLYYYAFLMLVAVFMNRTRIRLPAIFYSENPFMVLFTSLLLIVPYILLFLYLFRQMAVYPINKYIPEQRYKKLVKITYLMLITGSALLFLIPWVFNKLIPPIILTSP